MKKLSGILVLLLFLAGCMVIAGCSSNSPAQPSQTTIITPTVTAPTPQVSIVTPQNGAVIQAGSVPVTIKVSNFNIVDKQGKANAAGEGHVHFYLDVSPIPSDPAKPAIPANSNAVWAHVSGTSYTFNNVSPGMHTVTVQLVNNDHTPVIPLVTQSVMFTTTSGVVTATPTMTAYAGGTGGGQTTTINLTALNIAFDTSTITVPAGAHVVMNFDNQDAGIAHNFALYTDSSATQKIFVGDIVMGPKKITYTFDAPSTPGKYFFRCDVHPTLMFGTFIVT
jgi:plastocyanin